MKEKIFRILNSYVEQHGYDKQLIIDAENGFECIVEEILAEFNNKKATNDSKPDLSKLESHDKWFYSNLMCLIGGEISLINMGAKKNINRKSLGKWILKNK